MPKPKNYLYCWLLIFIMLALGCSTVPITGRRQLELVPSDQLMAMSADQYSEFMAKHEVITNTPDARMVAQVGNRISQAVERYFREQNKSGMLEGYKWEFNLIKDPSANAWAMSGGKVAVYSGILNIAQGENGLATIMGHEVAHAVAQHGNERMSQALLNQLGGVALTAALSQQPAMTKDLLMAAYGAGTQVGIMLPYSRLHETEADQMGLIFMAMAGYDPRQAVDFWSRMEKQGRKDAPPEFLSTHPAHATRIAQIKEYLPKAMTYYTRKE
ncbi:MAG: M48 family metallopeptidase [Desulfotignum sp.]